MIYVDFKVSEKTLKEAVLNEGHEGFKEDYLMLHELISRYSPGVFMEIGTNRGVGTRIIKNALPMNATLYSMDLPYEKLHDSLAFNDAGQPDDLVGSYCNEEYLQIRADSLEFDFKETPGIQGWFIDGSHDYKHVLSDSKNALLFYKTNRVIIWHDADMSEVLAGILDALDHYRFFRDYYTLYRVRGTRIAYAVNSKI